MSKVLIIDAKFYSDISKELVESAEKVLKDHDIKYETITVPGAFEIPAAIAFAHKSGKYDGYVALGCVIRGETTHYDYVCEESARGINDLVMKYNLAVGFGVLTVENRDQAWARANGAKGNKGAAAAYACLNMMKLKKHFGV